MDQWENGFIYLTYENEFSIVQKTTVRHQVLKGYSFQQVLQILLSEMHSFEIKLNY